MLEIVGYRCTTLPWRRAIDNGSWASTSTTNCFGAWINASGLKTTKKFVWKFAHCTSRRLVKRVGTSTPCTFQVTVSPSFTRNDWATLPSMEISGNTPAGCVAENHLPAVIFSALVSESRNVELYSRPPAQPLGRPSRPVESRDESDPVPGRRTGTPLIDATRIRTIGVVSTTVCPAARISESTPGSIGSCTSKNTTFARD